MAQGVIQDCVLMEAPTAPARQKAKQAAHEGLLSSTQAKVTAASAPAEPTSTHTQGQSRSRKGPQVMKERAGHPPAATEAWSPGPSTKQDREHT